MTDGFSVVTVAIPRKAHESGPRLKSQDIKVYKAHCPKKEFKSNTGCQTAPHPVTKHRIRAHLFTSHN